MSISVLIVDDNRLFRKAVVDYLSTAPDIQIVGQASNGIDAQAQVLATQPQVVVMDLSMPRMGGLEALRLLRLQTPGLPVILFTIHNDPFHVRCAIQNGACGYVLKEDTVDHLVCAIRAAASGEKYFSPRIQPLVEEQ